MGFLIYNVQENQELVQIGTVFVPSVIRFEGHVCLVQSSDLHHGTVVCFPCHFTIRFT